MLLLILIEEKKLLIKQTTIKKLKELIEKSVLSFCIFLQQIGIFLSIFAIFQIFQYFKCKLLDITELTV